MQHGNARPLAVKYITVQGRRHNEMCIRDSVWAYALFQVPGGWLSDRFGARRVLGTVVAYWSIMTAATGLAFSAGSFVAVRFLFGCLLYTSRCV